MFLEKTKVETRSIVPGTFKTFFCNWGIHPFCRDVYGHSKFDSQQHSEWAERILTQICFSELERYLNLTMLWCWRGGCSKGKRRCFDCFQTFKCMSTLDYHMIYNKLIWDISYWVNKSSSWHSVYAFYVASVAFSRSMISLISYVDVFLFACSPSVARAVLFLFCSLHRLHRHLRMFSLFVLEENGGGNQI